MLTFCVEVFEDGLKQNQLEKEMTLQRPATDEQCLQVRQEAVEALVSAHVTRSYVRRATKDNKTCLSRAKVSCVILIM